MNHLSDESTSTRDEPDVDAIKMFCGQIPRHISENELRQIFEEFGRVFHLNILRDKQTGESKGCCFVTFYSRKSAVDAQNALHNLRTLTGCHHPIQMKPADTENRNERKLFIGMISKNFDEQQIRQLFQSYGIIEDCTILRDPNGKSRGCAFITFQKRQCALNAIKSMHHSQTMEGCSSPLVVKLADTPKDKETRKFQQQFTPTTNNAVQTYGTPTNLIPDLGNLVLLQQLLKNYGFVSQNNNTVNLAAFNNLLQMFSNNFNLNGTKVPLLLPTTPTSSQGTNTSLNLQDLTSPRSSIPTASASSTTFNPDPTLFMCNVAGLTPTTNTHPYSSPIYTNGTGGTDTHHNLQNLVALSQMNSAASFPVYSPPSFVPTKHAEGPEGANLFIYHLPQEYSDADLIQTFAPYGPIVSAKVFVDKTTNRSKCFGFVSYDNPSSAQSAIHQMNGFQIGPKRLKVQLKKLRNDATYSHPSPTINQCVTNHSNDH